MGILHKRRKKRQLIDSINHGSRKAGHAGLWGKKAEEKASEGENLYLAHRRKFRNTVVFSCTLMFTLWWVPLFGPLVAGYIVGRLTRDKWMSFKALLIPVVFIVTITNGIALGLLPSLDTGREIGLFFMSASPGLYASMSPPIIAAIGAFNVMHRAMGIGANGYLIIALITNYLGSIVAEKAALEQAADGKKPAREADAKGGRFLFRKKEGKENFHRVSDRLKKGLPAKSAHNDKWKYPVTFGLPAAKSNPSGWVRKAPEAAAAADGAPAKGGALEPKPASPHTVGAKYTQRRTASSEAAASDEETGDHEATRPSGRSSVVSGSYTAATGNRVRTGMMPPSRRDSAPEGVDMVRRTHVAPKTPMSRGIIDRATHSYRVESSARDATTTASSACAPGQGDRCQMGSTFNKNREYESL